MEPTQRAQMIELSCTLQKQLLYHIMGEEAPKSAFSSGIANCDLTNESQIQAGKFLREHSGQIPKHLMLFLLLIRNNSINNLE